MVLHCIAAAATLLLILVCPSARPEPLSDSAPPFLDAPLPSDLSALRDALAQLEIDRTTLTTRLRDTQNRLEALELQISNEQRFYADAHANAVVHNALPSPRGAAWRSLECEGWRKTGRCSARGARRPAQDQSCFAEIRGGAAGYCEVRDTATHERFKVMRVDCASVRPTATFWCELAPQFANVPADIERAVVAAQAENAATAKESRGIVMVVRASQVSRLDRTLQTLRARGCTLPVEIWYFPADLGSAWTPTDLLGTLRPFTTLPFTPASTKYAAIHALVHTNFTHVLYLDHAVDVLRDPTFLFTSPAFDATGAVFWPDVVHPTNPESHVVAKSLLWELLDMPFVSMFEQDDRQLLLNRNRPSVRTALVVLELFAAQRPSLFAKLELVKQTKDYARLAWLKTRAQFHTVARPPTLAGSVVADGRFCGSSVVQYDPSGREPLFVHRLDDDNQEQEEEKTPETDEELTHMQAFEWQEGEDASDTMLSYDVRSFRTGKKTCLAHAGATGRFQTTAWRVNQNA